MTLRIVAASAACVALLIAATFAAADGMPEPDDENFNPVPSVPGKPAPGVTQPPPITPAKPAPAVEAPKPAPVVKEPTPAPAPAPAPTQPTPAPTPPPAAATPAPTPPPAAQPAAAQKKPIFEVRGVEIQILERQPPAATITVRGTSRTGGWTNIELAPLQTFAPEVGMKSYTLVGTPPDGAATQALSQVSVTVTLDPLPADVKTIRVLGETNEVAQTFR